MRLPPCRREAARRESQVVAGGIAANAEARKRSRVSPPLLSLTELFYGRSLVDNGYSETDALLFWYGVAMPSLSSCFASSVR